MKFPGIGELRHRLTLEQAVSAPDGGGGQTIAWSPVAGVWGAVRSITGRETPAAEALRGGSTIEIWIRHRTDVSPVHRLTAGQRIFDIKSVLDPDGRRRWLRIVAEERLG